MSKSSTKVVMAVLILVLLTGYYFLVFIPHRDKQAAKDFISVYEKYEKTNSALIVPLFASNLGGEGLGKKTLVDDANDKFGWAINSASDTPQARVNFAVAAIAAINKIIIEIDRSDKPQIDCEEAILTLNTAAASLKNSEMRKYATEICDLALERHNNLISYKQSLLEKRKLCLEAMYTIADGNGQSITLSSLLMKNTDRINKLNEMINKTNTDYGEQTSKIATIYARFKGLAGIQDKQ